MNRILQYFNLLGILLLAALCSIQWRANRRLNLDLLQLLATGRQQVAEIARDKNLLQENAADLDDFRERLRLSEAALKQSEMQLKQSQEQVAADALQLKSVSTERDRLKASIDQWTAAVAARDQSLKSEREQSAKALDDRNQAVAKFNDLAVKYNELVKTLDKPGDKKEPGTSYLI